MDRFKFRAWHVKNEVMVYFDKPDQYQLLHLFDLMNGTHSEDGIVEQCTGLKDKSGTLIYEGDIVKYTNSIKETYTAIVEHDTCNPCFILARTPARFESDVEFDFIKCGMAVLEVIGNIHENPELLEA